jgi:hypothetical protein
MIDTYGNYISTSYGPNTLAGYYDGVFHFYTETGETNTDIDFIDGLLQTSNSITTVSPHTNVIQMSSTNDAFNTSYIYHNFTEGPQTYGSFEFWWRTSASTGHEDITLFMDGATKIYVRCPNLVFDSNITVAANTWYIIRIDFRCSGADAYSGLSEDQYRFSIFNSSGSHLTNSPNLHSFYASATEIETFRLSALKSIGYAWVYNQYLDAWGATWHPQYSLGDNLSVISYGLPSSTYYTGQELTGGETLQSLLTTGAMTEQDVWALAPDGDVRWTNALTASGITLDGTQKVWDVNASIQARRVNRIVVKGAGGIEAIAENTSRQASAGHVITQTYYKADITNTTDLQTIADQLLDAQKDPPLRVTLALEWEAKGWIQVGETIHINASAYKYNESTSYIPVGDYRIVSETYHMVDGVYAYIELTLEDVLIYPVQEDPEKIDENTQNANYSYGGTVTGGGGGGGGGGLNNIVEDLSPQLGGDLGANTFDIYDIETLRFLSTGDLTIDTDAAGAELLIKTDGDERIGISDSGVIFGNTGARITDIQTTITDTDTKLSTSGAIVDFAYAKTDYLNVSAGAGDAGKPIKLDADGHVDATMINDGDIAHDSTSGIDPDDHHNEAHVLATSGPHTSTLPLTDLAAGTRGDIITVGASDWQVLNRGTSNYRLSNNGTDVIWAETVSNNAFDENWNDVTDVAPSKDAVYDAVNPLVAGVIYAGTWDPTSPDGLYPNNLESGTNGVTTAATVNFSSTGATFQSNEVAAGDILLLEDGNDEDYRIIATVPTETTLTVTGANFTGDTAITYQVFEVPSGGDYYITTGDGEAYNQFYENGDWLIWNETTTEWDRIRSYKGDNWISVGPGDNIQTAIDEIESVGSGTIFLEPGTHALSAGLTVNDVGVSITIVGSGDGSIIDCNGDRTAINITNAKYCRLEHFKIDATDVALGQEVIIVSEASNNKVVIESLTIEGH